MTEGASQERGRWRARPWLMVIAVLTVALVVRLGVVAATEFEPVHDAADFHCRLPPPNPQKADWVF